MEAALYGFAQSGGSLEYKFDPQDAAAASSASTNALLRRQQGNDGVVAFLRSHGSELGGRSHE